MLLADVTNLRAKPKKSLVLFLENSDFRSYGPLLTKLLLNGKNFKWDNRPMIFYDAFLWNDYLHLQIENCEKCILHNSPCIPYAIPLAIRYFGH